MTWLTNPYRFSNERALYWRVHSLAILGGFTSFVSEIEMAESIGGTNIAPTGTAFGTNPTAITNINDNNISTQNGANDGDAVFWGVQFASPKIIEEVRIAAAAIPSSTPTGFALQRSNDNVNWITTSIHLNEAVYVASEIRSFASLGLSLPDVADRAEACGWRVNVVDNDGGTTLQIAELVFKDSGGNSLIVGGGPTVKNCNNTTTLTASRAFDGNNSTVWASGGADDFSRIGYIKPGIMGDCATVEIRAGTTPSNSPADFTVEYTTNGSTWRSVGSFTSTFWSSGENRIFAV